MSSAVARLYCLPCFTCFHAAVQASGLRVRHASGRGSGRAQTTAVWYAAPAGLRQVAGGLGVGETSAARACSGRALTPHVLPHCNPQPLSLPCVCSQLTRTLHCSPLAAAGFTYELCAGMCARPHVCARALQSTGPNGTSCDALCEGLRPAAGNGRRCVGNAWLLAPSPAILLPRGCYAASACLRQHAGLLDPLLCAGIVDKPGLDLKQITREEVSLGWLVTCAAVARSCPTASCIAHQTHRNGVRKCAVLQLSQLLLPLLKSQAARCRGAPFARCCGDGRLRPAVLMPRTDRQWC